ncbi:MAG TPA: hypothetical protein DGB85_01140 [Deltaproteobacteria bacterium]|nr:hypothetical protein [Deltaproteobacteria bacterium]
MGGDSSTIDSKWPRISDRLCRRLLDFADHPSVCTPLALPVQATSDGTQSHRRGYSRICSHYWSLCHLGDWAAIRLGALGVNSASLAVAFEAVGIGLGFGLRNIFNNFASGLILLFERPIQLGNVIEINKIC